MLDEQKMIQLIASEPLIRTVALADRLDCEMVEVEEALRPMIDCGRIVAQPVTAPNNRSATGYMLSDDARGEILRGSEGVSIDAAASRIDRAIAFIKEHDTVTASQLHALLGLAPNDLVSRELAPAIEDGRLFKVGKYWTLGAAERCDQGEPAENQPDTGTKVDRAVAFVKANGSANDDELRKVMGIEKPYAPAAYLNSAIRNGKLHKNAGLWKPGPASAGGMKEAFSFARDKGPVAQFGPEVQPEEVADLPGALVAELSKPTQEVVSAARAEAAALPPPADSHEMLTFGQLGGIGDVNSSAKGSGARFNAGKADFSLIPMSTLEDEAKVWMYGREKYAAWNWTKGMKWSVPFACAMRHMAAWQRGEECDPESGLPHLAHAMCNLRMLTLYATNFQQGDDRPTKELQP